MAASVAMIEGVRRVLRSVTLEPVLLIDGACNQAMLLFIENVQMNKICTVNLNYSAEVRSIKAVPCCYFPQAMKMNLRA